MMIPLLDARRCAVMGSTEGRRGGPAGVVGVTFHYGPAKFPTLAAQVIGLCLKLRILSALWLFHPVTGEQWYCQLIHLIVASCSIGNDNLTWKIN
jgi:hypothetical protein